MEKIPTLFLRDETPRGHPVIDAVTPGCEWVLAGEGVATAKLDGVNVQVRRDEVMATLWKRRKPPEGVAYSRASYVPCDRFDPTDQWLFAAYDASVPDTPGLYEAVGPSLQGNPHRFRQSWLYSIDRPSHMRDVPRTFGGVRAWLSLTPRFPLWDPPGILEVPIEGVVFVHPDGRLAKIKRRDFGLPWPVAP